MKKLLILLVLLTAVSFNVSAQDAKKKDPYSAYQPCTECFEDWKVTESQSTETPNYNPSSNSSSRSSGNRKPFDQTFVGSEINNTIKIVIGGVFAVGTLLLLTHVNQPTVQ